MRPKYASSMTTKRKVSVSLDDDLVRQLEEEGVAVSTQVNAAVRDSLERRRRRRLLRDLLSELDTEHGPVPEEVVEKYVELLR